MNNPFGITYLILLSIFLSIFCFFLTQELYKIYKEKQILQNSKNKLNETNSLRKANLYLSKQIIDITIYELLFLIHSIQKISNIENIYILLGHSYKILNNNEKAEQYYSQTMEIIPNNTNLVINYLNILIAQKKITKAQKIYNHFLINNPTNIVMQQKFKNILD
uniref:hypothetical protein n=1 Tax=Pulvinaster venetus TaxID=427767 RepID=UPI001FCCFFC5|nr:hypothetical protein MW436_pgp143 [Pulvinaster venetus]UNJ16916.1 hypothetical protein [Pulvinaster venetus]